MKRISIEGILSGGILLFVFLIPWQTRWIYKPYILQGFFLEYGTLSWHISEIWMWLLVCLFVISALVHIVRKKKTLGKPTNGWPAVAIGIVFIFSSSFWALDAQISWQMALRILLGMIIFFFLQFSIISLRPLLVVFVATMTVQSVLGMLQVYRGVVVGSTFLGIAPQYPETPGVSVVLHAGQRILRAYGAFPHPNILGGYLAISLLVTLFLVFWYQHTKSTYFCLYLAYLLQWAGLLCTFSRSAWFAFLVGSAIFLVGILKKFSPRYQRIPFVLSIIGGTIAVCVVFFIFFPEALTRATFSSEASIERQSLVERRVGYAEAYTHLKKNPLLGVGIGNYTLRQVEMSQSMRPGYVYQPVHNIFLLALSELGIIGFFLFIWMLVGLARIVFSVKKQNYVSGSFIPGSALISSIFFLGMFDHYMWSLYSGIVLFWLTVGISVRSMHTSSTHITQLVH